MANRNISETALWGKVKKMLGDRELGLGQHWSYNLYNDPKRLAFVLSRYKFAAKMCSVGKRILELGCSEGIAVPILSEFARSYKGVDMDADAIEAAKRNWETDRVEFINDDFLGKRYGVFDVVISLDVVEHIITEAEGLFFDTIYDNLDYSGSAIVGTPNGASAIYASTASKAGHVNMFDAERLRIAMQRLFHNVFSFGLNDEVVHTGFAPMCHYLICLGCNKKSKRTR